MWNVVGYEKGTNKKIIIEPHMTEAQAFKMCEMWGWTYDDGRKGYYMDLEEENKPNETIPIAMAIAKAIGVEA